MSSDLTRVQSADFSPAQVELIKTTVAKGASDDELKLFLAVARRSGLDPFSRQIHFVKRQQYNRETRGFDSVGTIQTGIDGYRAIAERSGTLAGIDDAVFIDKGDVPVKASVTVYRFLNGHRVPFTASARFSEYAQRTKDGTLIGMWGKMPYLMLAKCAEAMALRKAFPNDLSGLYTSEEMAQADNDPRPFTRPSTRHDAVTGEVVDHDHFERQATESADHVGAELGLPPVPPHPDPMLRDEFAANYRFYKASGDQDGYRAYVRALPDEKRTMALEVAYALSMENVE